MALSWSASPLAAPTGVVLVATRMLVFLSANHWLAPYRFMATFGVHLGAYFGGLIGIITAVVRVVRLRRRLVETVNPSEVAS